MAQSFDVLFVGLFCFRIDDRKAVMPDARSPADPTIPPFTPFLVIDPKDINTSSGWEGNDPARTAQGIYILDKCTITITKATETAVLDPTQYNDKSAKLHDIDHMFAFDFGSTDIITTINLGQGKLELRKTPGSQDKVNVALLNVEHDGDIYVTVTVQGEAQARVLKLNPRSDVAIVNLPLAPITAAQTGDPCKEFGKIAVSRTFNAPAGVHVPGMASTSARYQVFKVGLDFISIEPATCCPPP